MPIERRDGGRVWVLVTGKCTLADGGSDALAPSVVGSDGVKESNETPEELRHRREQLERHCPDTFK